MDVYSILFCLWIFLREQPGNTDLMDKIAKGNYIIHADRRVKSKNNEKQQQQKQQQHNYNLATLQKNFFG